MKSFPTVGFTGENTEECVPDYPRTDYSYQPDVDYLKCERCSQRAATMKRLSLRRRRPTEAGGSEESAQGGISSGQWRSAESLSSSSRDDTRLLGMSSTTRGRPPLPPPHGSSPDNNKPSRNEGPATSPIPREPKPQPAARSSALRQSPVVETPKHLDQEATRPPPPPQPRPRRRLASFGGVSSHGSLCPFTGLGAYDQGNKPVGSGGDVHVHLSPSLGSRGSTGCLRPSPRSSAPSFGATHLQHVRDQMVVALQRLKELEEQVTNIPILQVKISVLQEEKRQLVSQLKNHSDANAIWKRVRSGDTSDVENKVHMEEGLGGLMRRDCTDLKEFWQPTEEMRAPERTIKGGRGKDQILLRDNAFKSVTVGPDEDVDTAASERTKENKGVHADQVEVRSIETEVSEVDLGLYTEREAEIDAQQLMIGALKERICHLEAELKESALQTEMSRLKLELRAAGLRSRADKASSAGPSTASVATEAGPHATSRRVGNHTELRDAGTEEATEVKTVGVSCCGPELKNICTGPDAPMSHWKVRERVETAEKGVGIRVPTDTRGTGMDVKVCDAETNTEVPVENLCSEKRKPECHSVDVGVRRAKDVVSQGVATDQVRGVDLGVMASPQTASQRTNTVSSSVSRFTNTRHAFNADSSTNTVLITQDKHTNTTQTVTRTVSVGNGVKDAKCTPETRTVGVGTERLAGRTLKQTTGAVAVVTRDHGVGFANVNENFLVGLKTRNMASGPSHLPDPVRTRSIGVGEGRIRNLSASSGTPVQTAQLSPQSKWDHELNHYIEKMHWLLREHGELLSEEHRAPTREGFGQQGELSCDSKAAERGGAEVHCSSSQEPGNTVDAGKEIRWLAVVCFSSFVG